MVNLGNLVGIGLGLLVSLGASGVESTRSKKMSRLMKVKEEQMFETKR